MPRRSVLFSPGDQLRMLRKAPTLGADVVVFDLEDAVAPDRKPAAREMVQRVLADSEFDPDCEVCVRLNPTGIAADDDLTGILGSSVRLDSVMLPKVDGPADIENLELLLTEHAIDVEVFAIVESAAGILSADAIAASGATDVLVFGAEDLAADIGATRTSEGMEVLYAREHVVIAAKAAGIDVIDTVYTDIEDVSGLRAESRFAIQLGFDGKLAIHPAQIEPINEAFTPEPEAVEWARTILETIESMEGDQGVYNIDGEMVDSPVISQAQRIIDRAAMTDEL